MMNHNVFNDKDPINPELLKNAEIAVRRGLVQSYYLHEELGEAGTEARQQNEFGDTAMAMDIFSEKVMLESLEQLPYRFLVRTEEHGELEVNEHLGGPRYLAVMDGLDGSSVYEKHRNEAGYGPMFAIFSNDNPTYDDYVVSGIMMLSSGEMLIAKKGEKLVSENVRTGEKSEPRAAQNDVLNGNAIVFADQSKVDPSNSLYKFFTLNGQVADTLHKHVNFVIPPRRTGSTAANIVDIATGEATLDIGATRKGNLEFASAYGILKAAGAVMETEGGIDLGTKRFLEFGQDDNILVLAAANKDIAKDAWSILAA